MLDHLTTIDTLVEIRDLVKGGKTVTIVYEKSRIAWFVEGTLEYPYHKPENCKTFFEITILREQIELLLNEIEGIKCYPKERTHKTIYIVECE